MVIPVALYAFEWGNGEIYGLNLTLLLYDLTQTSKIPQFISLFFVLLSIITHLI